MRAVLRMTLPLLAVAGLVVAVGPAGAAKSPPLICKGTGKKPGVLAGTIRTSVIIKGFCGVKEGKAKVIGTLTVSKGSAFAAAFGRNVRTHTGHSSLTVTGNLVVEKGATAILGCKVNADGSGFPCFDDRAKKPTLTSSETIEGNLIENAPLGVVVHNSKIGGSWKETGGGGGLNCKPAGPFKKFMSPVFSDIEDSSVGGNLTIKGLKSCYLAVIRVHIGGNATFTNDTLADPDAIEIESNHIGGGLACTGNSAVWDSSETSMSSNFPRMPSPNTVKGTRSGQCTLSTPTTQGGPSGPGPF